MDNAKVSMKHVNDFVAFASQKLKLKSLPKMKLVGPEEDKMKAFGHFVDNENGDGSVSVRVTDRHPIDIMRTIAHELIHHMQNVSGVSQEDRMKEDEANALAGRIMREYDMKHPNVFKDKPVPSVNEDGVAPAATNAMGGSSSTQGPINTFDPILGKKKKLREIIKKK
jgi:hypothetical protein